MAQVRIGKVIRFLDTNPGIFTYGEVSSAITGTTNSSQAVGGIMKAICSRGLHEYCPRVVNAQTLAPGAPCGGRGRNFDISITNMPHLRGSAHVAPPAFEMVRQPTMPVREIRFDFRHDGKDYVYDGRLYERGGRVPNPHVADRIMRLMEAGSIGNSPSISDDAKLMTAVSVIEQPVRQPPSVPFATLLSSLYSNPVESEVRMPTPKMRTATPSAQTAAINAILRAAALIDRMHLNGKYLEAGMPRFEGNIRAILARTATLPPHESDKALEGIAVQVNQYLEGVRAGLKSKADTARYEQWGYNIAALIFLSFVALIILQLVPGVRFVEMLILSIFLQR